MPEPESLYSQVQIKPQAAKSINAGHPWCYAGSVVTVPPELSNGGLCEVMNGGQFNGIATYSPGSDIALRVLTRKRQKIDTGFFMKCFRELKDNKESWLTDTNAYRLCYGESDGLPGLVADVYNRAVILQIHTMGMEKLKNTIVSALIPVMKPQFIYERSHTAIREREGLPAEQNGALYGQPKSDVIITENGFQFEVNVIEGQKTGFFLDQRENRAALVRYCRDKRVLNCFSYTGGFSVYAASVAAYVNSVDISKPAVEGARRNFTLNGHDAALYGFTAADTFDVLKSLTKGEYDVIILDPPSFAKKRDQLDAALKAYTTINSKALEKLPEGGILVSSSCSTQVDEPMFLKMLAQSAVNARCTVKVLESRCQPPDHPYNLAFPEGRYLKFFVLQKWNLC